MENKHHQPSGFLNGFIIGLLVGVGIALLFTTKKGRRILKTLSEEGLEKVSNFDELMKRFENVAERAVSGTQEEDTEEEEDATDYVPQRKVLLAESVDTAPKTVTIPPIQINTTGEEEKAKKEKKLDTADALAEAVEKVVDDMHEEEALHKVKPTRRRFFRGIPKRG